jgi:ribose transport system ATP-binding protein
MTQGVDVATKLELYRVVRRLANEGAAVLLLSSDLPNSSVFATESPCRSAGVVDQIAAAEMTEERIVGSAIKAFGWGDDRERAGVERARSQATNSQRLFPSLVRRYGAWVCLSYRSARKLHRQSIPVFFDRAHPETFDRPVGLGCARPTAVILVAVMIFRGPLISLTTAVASYALVSNSPGGMAVGSLSV